MLLMAEIKALTWKKRILGINVDIGLNNVVDKLVKRNFIVLITEDRIGLRVSSAVFFSHQVIIEFTSTDLQVLILLLRSVESLL